MTSELPKANLRSLFLLLIGRRKRFKIVGKSMQPLLEPGEEILINPYAYIKAQPKINDLIITSHPHNSQLTIIKRVTEMAVDGSYFLTGDNQAESTDSRHWGTVCQKKILGKVTSRFI
jgi:nickel-type superoxide dismutase maturation protease